MHFGILAFFLWISVGHIKCQDQVVTQPKAITPKGTYLGSTHLSPRKNRTVFAFTGIPYARPPIDQLRFREPIAMDDMPPIFDATKNPPECLQWDYLLGRGMVGSEDCLYLNVYTTKIPEAPLYPNTMPILVLLHAGTWMSGSGASDIFTPDYLIENDIMVITINHRLGPFGFLSLENTEAPGNYGLLDQIKALEWIKENARYFGGMNDTVTVMGSGAGGISAHLLSLTPRARGASLNVDDAVLVQGIISHSGTAYSPHALVKDSSAQGVLLAIKVGCNAESPKIIMECLRKVPGETIINAIPTMFLWDEEPLLFGPVVDKKWMGSEAIIPDEPFHLIKKRQFLNIPWIVGTNKNDGAFRVQDILKDQSLVTQLNTKWEKYGPILLHLTKYSCKDPVDMANKIRDFYMGNKKFGSHSEKQFIEMMTDRFFLFPTDRASKEQCVGRRHDRQYCYRYEHHYCGRKTFLDILHKVTPQETAKATFGGSHPRFQNTRDAHGFGMSFLDELLYLFPSSKFDFHYDISISNDDPSAVSSLMITMWTNFIKGGDPTPIWEGIPEDASPWGAWWEPYMKGTYYYLQIDPEMETQETVLKEKEMNFWENLPLYENRDQNVIRDEL